jgi:hypothetical protein
MAVNTPLAAALRQLALPAFMEHSASQAALATTEGWPHERYLLALCELEI